VRAARAVPGGPAQGEIQAVGEELLLGSADGALRLEVVQPPGKKPMSAADFLRGHPPPAKAR
jgi:methionyl-tRNA formyltransferase